MSSTRKLAGLRLPEEVLQRIDTLLRARYGHLSARFSRTAIMEHWIIRALEAEEQGAGSSSPLAQPAPAPEPSLPVAPEVRQPEPASPGAGTPVMDSAGVHVGGAWHVYRGVNVAHWGTLRLLRETLSAVEDPEQRARLRALSDEAVMTARRGTLNLGGSASDARALEVTLPGVSADGVRTERVLIGVALPDPAGSLIASLLPLNVSGARSTLVFPTRTTLDVGAHALP